MSGLSTPSLAAMLVLSSVALAAAAVEAPAPYTLSGATADEAQAKKAGDVLGSHGVWFVRSLARWNDLQEKLEAVGCKRDPANASREIDFEKANLVVVFAYGDEGDKFSVQKLALANGQADLQLGLGYVIYKQRDKVVNKFHYLAVDVPKVFTTKVSLGSFHPQNEGPHPAPDKAQLEWTHEFKVERGDVVAGLTGVIRAAAATVKPGDDIRLSFELQFAAASQVQGEGHFATAADKVYVWDGKYSNGYRNHAFVVQSPDGKTQVLRPKAKDWEKNAPHPVAISAGKPYVLPNWAEGDKSKSLGELGFKPTLPGHYTITGVYTETGSPATADGQPGMWGGNLATNTVVVEVK